MGRLAAVLAAGVLAASAWAQPPPPPPSPDEGGFNVWDHLDLELVGLYSGGGAITREAFKLEATWNQRFGRHSLTVAAEFEDKTTSIEAELESQYDYECDPDYPERRALYGLDDGDCDPTRTLELDSEGSAVLSELYFNWVALDNLEVGVGISPIGWGQFLLISPINFMLPQSLGADLGLSRGTLQSPQPHVSVRWAPTDRLEVEAYYFNSVAVDPTIVAVDLAEFNSALPSGLEYPLDEAYDFITDKTQTALRLVYRPDWGAVGVTYLDGVSHFSTHRHESVVRTDYFEVTSDPATPQVYRYRTCPGLRARSPNFDGWPGCSDNPDINSQPFFGELADATYFGLEFAFNLGGGWNLLGEWSRMDSVAAPLSPLELSRPFYKNAHYVDQHHPDYIADGEVNPANANERLSYRSLVDSDGNPNPRFLDNDFQSRQICNFNEALIGGLHSNCNSLQEPGYIARTKGPTSRSAEALGSTEFPYSLDILSIGVEKLSTEEVGWSYSLQLLLVAESYDDPEFDGLYELYELTGSEYPIGTQIFPGFYAIQNHLFFNRPGQLVIGTGFFASFAGVVGLWNVEVTDNLSMQLGMELVTRVSDMQQVDAEGENRWDIPEGLAPAVNLGFSLAF